MKKFCSIILSFLILLSSVCAYAKYEIPYTGLVDNPILKELIKTASRSEDSGLMYPPEKHPYIYVNDEFIAHLKSNKNDEVYKQAYTYQMSLAKKALPAQPKGGILDVGISNQLMARAFMYAMGEFDGAFARETVDYAIEYIENAQTAKTYSIDIYKDFGLQGIRCGALVYDWCYGAMTLSQRSELASAIKTLMYASVQPCRPDNVGAAWGDLNGKAVGWPLVYTSIAVSALYDQYPDMYEAVMAKVQGSMAEASKIYGEAGALTDGSTSYSREWYTYYVEILFKRMGHDISDKYGVQLPFGYKLFYSRLPYGTHIKTGDSWTQTDYVFGTYGNSVDIYEDMGMLQVLFDDPYLKHYYQRDNNNANTIFDLLLKKSTHKAATPDDLPLAFESFEPRSEIIHKTSWQEGVDSPQVTAYMNMHNRRSGDHDHCEHGTFQLHYKGPLTIANGIYSGECWGMEHWRNYLNRTVSKNGLLIKDPNEGYTFGPKVAEANDGGQKMASNKSGEHVITDLKEHMSDSNLKTLTEGTYIGPNENTPAFSYIKGDLTGAYLDTKLETYKRSMVFMDTFNKTYPGVLVVFDHVISSKASFEKTWLLQAVAEPHISGNKITIDNSKTEPDANGKLVNTVLYPEQVKIESVGGIDKFISDGTEYPAEGEYAASASYKSGFRAEVKPQKANKEDIFLNAMFVTDADTTAPDLEITKIEDGDFMGAAVLDRQVMFKKDGNPADKEFTVTVKDNNGGNKMLVLLTDVAEGKWRVFGAETDIVLESKKSDNAFAFECKPGVYTISPANDESETAEIVWPEAQKEKIGDFAIKVGTSYQYMREPNKLVNGIPYIGESFINCSTTSTAVQDGNNLIISAPGEKTMILTAGSNTYKITDATGKTVDKTTDNAPFIDENGVFYWNWEDGIGTTLGLNCLYIPSAKALIITERAITGTTTSTGEVIYTGKVLDGVDESRVVWPVSIFASTDDGNVPTNLIDRELGTRWSSIIGDEEWVCFYMGEEAVEMSAVQIAFYNGDKRNWKFDIQISDDGENFTTVLKDHKSSGTSLNLETFKLPAGTKAKYIRYLGHGEEVTGSFYNSVTEFIIINE